MVLRRKNVNPNKYVHCCVISGQGNSLLHFGLNIKVSCEGPLGGGGVLIILKNLYLNDYAEFDSKISYMFFTWLSPGLWNIYDKDPRFYKRLYHWNVRVICAHPLTSCIGQYQVSICYLRELWRSPLRHSRPGSTSKECPSMSENIGQWYQK